MTANQKQLLSIIAAVIILAGGYVWATKYRTNPSPLPNPPPQGEGNNEETADWETYRNEKYGFEFNYPADWGIARIIKPPTESQLLIVSLQKKEVGDADVPVIAAEVDSNYRTSESQSSKTINIDGEQGFENQSEDPLAAEEIIWASWPHNGLGYNLSVRWSFSDKSAEEITNIYHQILSTFKFTR